MASEAVYSFEEFAEKSVIYFENACIETSADPARMEQFAAEQNWLENVSRERGDILVRDWSNLGEPTESDIDAGYVAQDYTFVLQSQTTVSEENRRVGCSIFGFGQTADPEAVHSEIEIFRRVVSEKYSIGDTKREVQPVSLDEAGDVIKQLGEILGAEIEFKSVEYVIFTFEVYVPEYDEFQFLYSWVGGRHMISMASKV